MSSLLKDSKIPEEILGRYKSPSRDAETSGSVTKGKIVRQGSLLDAEEVSEIFATAKNDEVAFRALKKYVEGRYSKEVLDQHEKKHGQTDEQFILEDPLLQELIQAYAKLQQEKKRPSIFSTILAEYRTSPSKKTVFNPEQIDQLKALAEAAENGQTGYAAIEKYITDNGLAVPASDPLMKALTDKYQRLMQRKPNALSEFLRKYEPKPHQRDVDRLLEFFETETDITSAFSAGKLYLKEVIDDPVFRIFSGDDKDIFTPLELKNEAVLKQLQSDLDHDFLAKNNPLIFSALLDKAEKKNLKEGFPLEYIKELNDIVNDNNKSSIEQLKSLISYIYKRGEEWNMLHNGNPVKKFLLDAVATYLALANPFSDEYEQLIYFLFRQEQRKNTRSDEGKFINRQLIQDLLLIRARQLDRKESLDELKRFATFLDKLEADYDFGKKNQREQNLRIAVSRRIKDLPWETKTCGAIYLDGKHLRQLEPQVLLNQFSTGKEGLEFVLDLFALQRDSQLPFANTNKEFLLILLKSATQMVVTQKPRVLEDITEAKSFMESFAGLDDVGFSPEELNQLRKKLWVDLTYKRLADVFEQGNQHGQFQTVFKIIGNIYLYCNTEQYLESEDKSIHSNSIFRAAYSRLNHFDSKISAPFWSDYKDTDGKWHTGEIFVLNKSKQEPEVSIANNFIHYSLEQKLAEASRPKDYQQIIKAALRLSKKGFAFSGKTKAEIEANKNAFLARALPKYLNNCRHAAEYKDFLEYALYKISNGVQFVDWQKLAEKITTFDEYKALIEAIETFPIRRKGKDPNKSLARVNLGTELTRTLLDNTANLVAKKLLSSPDKHNFLNFVVGYESKCEKEFLSTECRKELGYNLTIYYGKGNPPEDKDIKENILYLYHPKKSWGKRILEYAYKSAGKIHRLPLEHTAVGVHFDYIVDAVWAEYSGRPALSINDNADAKKAIFEAVGFRQAPNRYATFAGLLSALSGQGDLLNSVVSKFINQLSQERKRIWTGKLSDQDAAVSDSIYKYNSNEQNSSERRCKDLLVFLYPHKAQVKFSDDSLEQRLIVDALIAFMLVKEPSLEQFQSIIYFLYDLKLAQGSSFTQYDENLIRDLLVMKAQSLQTDDEIKKFCEFFSKLQDRYRMNWVDSSEKRPDAALKKEIHRLGNFVHLSYVTTKEGEKYTKGSIGQGIKDLKSLALSRGFFKGDEYTQQEWDFYAQFVKGLIAAQDKTAMDRQFLEQLLMLGIERIPKDEKKAGLFSGFSTVSKEAQNFIQLLSELKKEGPDFANLQVEVLIRQAQLLKSVSDPKDSFWWFVRQLSAIYTHLNNKDKSELSPSLLQELRNRLLDEGIKKLTFLNPGSVEEAFEDLFVSAGSVGTGAKVTPTNDSYFLRDEVYRNFYYDLIVKAMQTYQQKLDTNNSAHCIEFINGLYRLAKIAPENIKSEIGPLVKDTLNKWRNSIKNVAGYADYIGYVSRSEAKWLGTNQLLPQFEAEKLISLLKTYNDYKTILKTLLLGEEHSAFVIEHLAFLTKKAPVTVLTVIEELKTEGKLSGTKLKQAENLIATEENRCPLLRSLINLWGREEFFKVMVEDSSRLAKFNQLIVKLKEETTYITTGDQLQCKLEDAAALNQASAAVIFLFGLTDHPPTVKERQNRKFLLNALTLSMLLPKPSHQIYEHHLRLLYQWDSLEDKIRGQVSGYDRLINDFLVLRAQSLQTPKEFQEFKDFLTKLQSEGKFSESRLEQKILDALNLENPPAQTEALAKFQPTMLLTQLSTPEEISRFLNEALKLKEAYQLTHEQMDKRIFMRILEIWVKQVTEMETSVLERLKSVTQLNSPWLSYHLWFSGESEQKLLPSTISEFISLLDALLHDTQFNFFSSDSEKTQLHTLQHRMLMARAKFMLSHIFYESDSNRNFTDAIYILKFFYDFCKKRDLTEPHYIDALFELVYDHIGRKLLFESDTLLLIKGTGELGKNFIDYAVDKSLQDIKFSKDQRIEYKNKKPAELFESFILKLHKISSEDKWLKNIFEDYGDKALKSYADYCAAIKEDWPRFTARRFNSEVQQSQENNFY